MLTLFVLLSGCLVACSGSTAPVVKVGLVAPFEGRYRAIGYEAVYAARLAIREINRAGGVAGFRIELIALDDGGDRDVAIEQARKLAIDPQVLAVVGHYRADTTDAAIDTYCAERLPLLAVESGRADACAGALRLTLPTGDEPGSDPDSFIVHATVPLPDRLPAAANFVDAYNAIPIDGTRAGPIALQTYDAMYLVFDALARDAASHTRLSREGTARALARSDFVGLGGVYQFDEQGYRVDAENSAYRYRVDREPEPIH